MKIQIAASVKVLLQRLEEAGFEAYAVGGCVRDSLLGKNPQDWDICTSAHPEDIKACFSHLRTILTGERFGTVTVIYEEEAFEITTFREETGYSDLRHPDGVRFVPSLKEDLARRDFTVNAMAADSSGEITDCFGGLEDLKEKRIRCVGQPETRFSEDALRMLRGLRFSSKLGFSIEPETADAIHALREKLLYVAPERLKKELDGLLLGDAAAEILRSYADVLCLLIPEWKPCVGFKQYNYHHALDVWEHSLAVLEACEKDPVLRLAALLHDVGKPSVFTFDKNLVGHFYGHSVVSAALCGKILRRLRYDNKTIDTVQELVRFHDYPLVPGNERQLRRLLGKLGQEQLHRLLRLKRADALGTKTVVPEEIEADFFHRQGLLQEILEKESCFSLKQLDISGRELMAMGIPKGPLIGEMLEMLLTAVLDGCVQNRQDELVKYARNTLKKRETN